jgi:hypothetical protein
MGSGGKWSRFASNAVEQKGSSPAGPDFFILFFLVG